MNIYPRNELQENANELLNKIDPFNNKQITFSDCISLFSEEYVYLEDDQGNRIKINVLDKLSNDDSILK
jgi:hypothetical protein